MHIYPNCEKFSTTMKKFSHNYKTKCPASITNFFSQFLFLSWYDIKMAHGNIMFSELDDESYYIVDQYLCGFKCCGYEDSIIIMSLLIASSHHIKK